MNSKQITIHKYRISFATEKVQTLKNETSYAT